MEQIAFASKPTFTGEWSKTVPGRNELNGERWLLELEVTFSQPVNRSWLSRFVAAASEHEVRLSGDMPEGPTDTCRFLVDSQPQRGVAAVLRKALQSANQEGGSALGVIRGADSALSADWD